MHWTTDAYVTALGRTTLMVTVSAVLVGFLVTRLRIRSTAIQRLAWTIVLLQGCLLVQVPIVVEQTAPAPAQSNPPVLSATPVDSISAEDLAVTAHRRDAVAADTPPVEKMTAALSTVAPTASDTSTKVAAIVIPWNRLLVAIWLGGAILVLAVCACRYVSFMRLLRTTDEPQPDWREEFEQVRAELAGPGRVTLRIAENLGPCLVRRLRGSCIVVPQSLWTALEPHQRRAILRHELAHYVRGDLWKSIAVRLLSAPQWFNPAAWWAVRRFDECAEWACDELAAGDGASSTEYSRLLLSLGTAHAPRATYLPAARRGSVSTRIRRLLAAPGRDSRFVCCAIPLCAAVLLAVNMLRIEVVAQTPGKPAATVAPTTADSPRRMPWHPDDLVAVLGDERGKLWSHARHLMLTPDGRRLIANAGHSSLFIYDADTLDVLATFGDRPTRLMSAALSQDGSRLIAGYADGSMTLWNISGEQPELEQTVNVMPADVEQPYLHYNHALRTDRVAITVRNRLMLWELQGGRLQQMFATQLDGEYVAAVLSPDGRRVVTKVGIRIPGPIPPERIVEVNGLRLTRHDCRLTLWDFDGERLNELHQLVTPEIEGIIFAPDGQTLIGGSPSVIPPQVTRCVRIADNQLVEQPDRAHVMGDLNSPVFSPDGRLMVLMGATATSAIVDISNDTWQTVANLNVGLGLMQGAVFGPAGDSLYISIGSTLQHWKRDAGGAYARTGSEPDHSYLVGDVLFNARANTLLSAGGQTLCEWELRQLNNAQPRVHALNLMPSEIHRLVAWPDRNAVLYHNTEMDVGAYIRMWSPTQIADNKTFQVNFGPNYHDDAWCFAVQPGGKLLTTGHWDRAIRFWNLEGEAPRKVAELGAHNGHVCGVAFSPDGRTLASVGWDHAVKLWDMTTDPPSLGGELGTHDEIVRSVAFSPDGRWLVSGDQKGVIKMWDLRFNELSGVMIRHSEDVARVASPYDEQRTMNTLEFSADGQRLLSADGGGRVTVWTVPTGEIIKRWTFPGWVWAARWSPDQQLIATANQNGTVYLLVAPQP